MLLLVNSNGKQRKTCIVHEDVFSSIHIACGPDEWTCRNGDCIPGYQRCDRTPQCLDRSDEENCRPEPGLFSLHCVLEIILGVWMLSFVEDYVTSYRVIKRVWDQYNK